MKNESKLGGPFSVRPVLLLSFLAAGTPTAVLFSLMGNRVAAWPNAQAHAVLSCASAIVDIAIALWLFAESRRIRHPALASLSVGFAGLSMIAATSAFIQGPLHMAAVRAAIVFWLTTFCALTLLMFLWPAARHICRQWLVEHPLRFCLGLLSGLIAFAVAFLFADYWIFQSPEYAAALRTATFTMLGVETLALMLFSLWFYWRKRNTVILFFSLGLYFHALAVVGQSAAPAWSPSWWFGDTLYLTSVFAIAFGILEASWWRDRIELIDTLAMQSEQLQKSHADLTRSEAQYRSLVNNAPCGIFRLNYSEQFEAANPTLIEILGFESVRQLMELDSCAALFKDPAEYRSVMLELRKTGRVEEEVQLMRKDGAAVKVRLACRRVITDHGETPSYEGVVEDLRTQSSLEDQLRQSQKMEAVGRLAGGIAHDFNNLLTIISGYSRMLIDSFAPSDPRRNDTERIKTASERATALTRQLLAFSRKQVLTPTTLNLNTVVSDLSKILPRLIGEDVDLAFAPGDRLHSVYADRGQVEQVLMNLIVNARDAMPEGGKVTLETRNEKLDEKNARRRRGMLPGEYVMLAVTDTGCGMDAETQARMFEPFFTTKEEGKGTGLGLATVYGIVKQSGGHISVYTEPGRGTTFKVYLPAATPGKEKEGNTFSPNRLPRAETIMVVEDENDLRNMIVRALGRRGYTVLQAGSGEEAVDLVRKQGHKIDLLITDVIMPGMRGTEAAQRLLELAPDLRIVYMSGYTDNALFHQNLLESGSVFMQKPFTIDVLEEKVRQALKSRPKSQPTATG